MQRLMDARRKEKALPFLKKKKGETESGEVNNLCIKLFCFLSQKRDRERKWIQEKLSLEW